MRQVHLLHILLPTALDVTGFCLWTGVNESFRKIVDEYILMHMKLLVMFVSPKDLCKP